MGVVIEDRPYTLKDLVQLLELDSTGRVVLRTIAVERGIEYHRLGSSYAFGPESARRLVEIFESDHRRFFRRGERAAS